MTDETTPSPRAQSLRWSDSPEWPATLERARIRYRLKWARSKSRFWYYDRASRQPTAIDPTWRSSRWPWFGGDEYGRKTIVIPIPFHGEFVWAFWTWKGEDDHAVREQTWEFEMHDAERTKEFEDTFILVKEVPFVDVKHELDDCDLRWSMYAEGDKEEVIECAVYPLDDSTLRLYPIYDTDTTVTVRVEVGDIGKGLRHLSQQWPYPMA